MKNTLVAVMLLLAMCSVEDKPLYKGVEGVFDSIHVNQLLAILDDDEI
jgi:hypothetical protein